jgi:hypothetical protein
VLLDQVNGQIELLESQEPLAGTSESGTHMPEDGQDWLQEGDHELKRVKVRLAGFPPSQCVDHGGKLLARHMLCRQAQLSSS